MTCAQFLIPQCVCVDSSWCSSQSVSESDSVWRQDSSILEGTIWTQRDHHTVWGTVCCSGAEEARVQLSGTKCKSQVSVSTWPQISYSGLRSFDPSVPLQRPGLTVSLPSNATHHLFSQLHPGVTYQLSIRASTSKGFGPATTLNVTTNISGRFKF